MKRLVSAIQFLTIFPVSREFHCPERDLGRSALFFPLVGLLIGGVLVLCDYGLNLFLPLFPASVLTLMVLMGISGGLHLDGLADTADGLLSSRSRDRMLEIMRDSRVGPMGVVAVVGLVILKVAALNSISTPLRWQALLLMPLAGRFALVLSLSILPYVRSEGGLADLFFRHRSRGDVIWGFLLFASAAFAIAGNLGWVMVALTVAITLLFSNGCRQKIGGFTGDTLGASCELAETAVLLAAASWTKDRWFP